MTKLSVPTRTHVLLPFLKHTLYPMNKSVTAYRQANKIEGMKSSVLTGRPPTNVGLVMVAVVMVVQTQERDGQVIVKAPGATAHI